MEYKVIFSLLFILWLIGLGYLIYWGTRPFEVNPLTLKLPSSFLGLSSQLRKRALDFAWILGLEPTSSLPYKLAFRKILSGILLIISIILIFFIFIFSIEFLFKSSDYINENKNIILFFLTFFIISLFLLYKYFSLKKLNAQTAEEDEAKANYNEGLKRLAITFIQERYQSWIDEMDQIAKLQAQTVSEVKNASSFTLFSYEFSLTPSGMPSKKLGVTYIFSNGFISVVSNVVFDLLETSYSYVNSDTPTLSLNSPDAWYTEEFHYRDVIECNYKPADNSSNSVKFSDKEFPVDGILTLNLVNGSIKEYPTTKKTVSNFLTLAREKIRSSKTSQDLIFANAHNTHKNES